MSASDLTTVAFIFKRDYSNHQIADITQRDHVWWAKIQKEAGFGGDGEGPGAVVVMETKVAKLVEMLEGIKESDPTAKCLVFTQFKSTLEWLTVQQAARARQPA